VSGALAHGFDKVSVSDIAERAEVGGTTFFRYFGDKQEVVFAKQQVSLLKQFMLLPAYGGICCAHSCLTRRRTGEADGEPAWYRPVCIACGPVDCRVR
jgi:hypothetical protein